MRMKHLFDSDVSAKHAAEQWVAGLFCAKFYLDVDGSFMRALMNERGANSKLLHEHSSGCCKYQHLVDNKCPCRHRFGKKICEIIADDDDDDEDDGGGVVAPTGAQCVLDRDNQSYVWKLERDHCMAMPHSDALYEIHYACGGMENFNHFCELVSSGSVTGNGKDAEDAILYVTKYLNKL